MRNKNATDDFFGECTIGSKMPHKEFEQRFCRVCKNQECARAGWGESQWVQRMNTQVDRLLENPQFADPRDPQYQHIREHDFPDLLREAIRVEIIEQKGDWSIPDEVDVMTSVGAKGVQVPSELNPSSTAQSENDGDILNPEEPTPSPTSEPNLPPKMVSESLTSEQANPESKINTEEKKGVSLYSNTPYPKEGLMIDGTRPVKQTKPNPSSDASQWDAPVRQPSRFTLDSWSSPELTKPKNVVKKGARIQMSSHNPPSPDKK